MNKSKKIYLYDPRYNIKIETNYKELENTIGINKKMLAHYKCKRRKIGKINKYLIDDNITIEEKKQLYEKETYKDEIWKTITGYDYIYKISNYGRVKKICKSKEDFLLPSFKKRTNYLYVKLKKNNKFIQTKIYKLVAEHFLYKEDENMNIIHKNNILYDNRASNLEYITKKELGKLYGKNSQSLATYEIDPMTFEILNIYKSGRDAAKDNYLSHQTIFDIINYKTRVSCDNKAFILENDYEEILKIIDEKEYILFDSINFKKTKGTLYYINNKSNIGIHNLLYMYKNQKCISNNNLYLVDLEYNNFNKLYKNSTTQKELWRKIEINNFNNYEISIYGRVRKDNKQILIPFIKNNIKCIYLKDENGNKQIFEIPKLLCLSFKKNMLNNKKFNYEDIKSFKTLYANNDFYDCSSTNIELFKDIDSSLNENEENMKIFSVSKKKKIIKDEYENIYELSEKINKSLKFIYMCIKENRRINNNFYMFENNCKDFKYEINKKGDNNGMHSNWSATIFR